MAEEHFIAVEVLPTGTALGADVRGINLSHDFDAAVFRQIYKAWNDHLVLRFRDQWLDDAALVTFSRRFGELDMAPTRGRSATASTRSACSGATAAMASSRVWWSRCTTPT